MKLIASSYLQFSFSKSHQSLSKEWTAFCDFHLGNYRKSLEQYEALKEADGIDDGENRLNIAVCMFYLGKCVKILLVCLNDVRDPLFCHRHVH